MLKSLEYTLSELQRLDANARSAIDLKKQNLKSEENKHKELVKCMQEVRPLYVIFFLSARVVQIEWGQHYLLTSPKLIGKKVTRKAETSKGII